MASRPPITDITDLMLGKNIDTIAEIPMQQMQKMKFSFWLKSGRFITWAMNDYLSGFKFTGKATIKQIIIAITAIRIG
jgi:hypothetical protein